MTFNDLTTDKVPNELRFSSSRLSTYDGCWKKAEFIYHKGYRIDYTSPALTMGRIIHRILELHYSGLATPIEAYPKYLNDEFPTFKEQQDVWGAVALCQRYVNYFAKKDNFKILGIEKELVVPYTTPNGVTVYLHAIMDLIGLTEKDELFVMDHKSSARNVWNKEMVWFDAQIAFYMCVLMQLDFEPNIGVINQISTATKDATKIGNVPAEKLFTRIPVRPTPRMLEAWLREFGEKIDRILEADFFPRSLRNTCSSCPYREACSMELQGIDSLPYLEANFNSRNDTEYEIEIDIEGFEG